MDGSPHTWPCGRRVDPRLAGPSRAAVGPLVKRESYLPRLLQWLMQSKLLYHY
jgi:hypothetical protein